MSLVVVPSTVKSANGWVRKVHRHRPPVQGGLFAAGLVDTGRGDDVVAVGIAGRPCRLLADGWTVEITRIASDGTRNACSKLYGCLRAAAASLGYRRVYTYTLEDEPGTSLRAAGFVDDGLTEGGSWSRPSRPRIDKHPTGPKRRWVWPAEARGR